MTSSSDAPVLVDEHSEGTLQKVQKVGSTLVLSYTDKVVPFDTESVFQAVSYEDICIKTPHSIHNIEQIADSLFEGSKKAIDSQVTLTITHFPIDSSPAVDLTSIEKKSFKLNTLDLNFSSNSKKTGFVFPIVKSFSEQINAVGLKHLTLHGISIDSFTGRGELRGCKTLESLTVTLGRRDTSFFERFFGNKSDDSPNWMKDLACLRPEVTLRLNSESLESMPSEKDFFPQFYQAVKEVEKNYSELRDRKVGPNVQYLKDNRIRSFPYGIV